MESLAVHAPERAALVDNSGPSGDPSGSQLLASVPEGVQPRYPPNAIPNPAATLRCDAKLGDTPLRRPALLPPEVDERIARESIYMVVGPQSDVLYLTPGACERCASQRQWCDRREPTCGRCAQAGAECALGPLCEIMIPSSDKGKGRETVLIGGDDEGRGKRIKKPRRMTDEVDPNLMNVDGSARKPRAPPKKPQQLPPPNYLPYRPEDVTPTPEDEAYAARVRKSDDKPKIEKTRGICPVWAVRRRALFAATEYLRDPVPTVGASVQIGDSGIARGVLLEGQPSTAPFFGAKDEVGTILVAIGPPRRRYSKDPSPPPPMSRSSNIADAFNANTNLAADPEALKKRVDVGVEGVNPVQLKVMSGTGRDEVAEPAPLEALFMAQRARTPVALAVSEDYVGFPFKLPRPLVVLGWFWVTDAWTVPVDNSDLVSWYFEFECCGDKAEDLPWWSPESDPKANGTPYIEGGKATWPVRGPGISGPTTPRGRKQFIDTSADAPFFVKAIRELEFVHKAGVLGCSKCRMESETAYEGQAPCLNERCEMFFKDVRPKLRWKQCVAAACPGAVREMTRFHPSQLNLDLVGPDVQETPADVQRYDANADLWRAWVCRQCRCANERRDWIGFVCEGCGLVDKPRRKVYSADALAPPMRIKYTAQRPPDQASTLIQYDHMEVPSAGNRDVLDMVYVLDKPMGDQRVRITHSTRKPIDADEYLLRLQDQGEDQIPFARHYLSATSSRTTELALSPFYTFAYGDKAAPALAHFPTSRPRPWKGCPPVINSIRAVMKEGSMMPPDEDFSSLMIAAFPASLRKHFVATIPFPPHSDFCNLMVLGSDATFRFRNPATGATVGDLIMYHGDRIELTNDCALEIQIKMDGFGFIVLGRVWPPITDTRDRPVLAIPAPPVLPKEAPQWYIGPFPIDPSRPLRAQGSSRTDDDFLPASSRIAPIAHQRLTDPPLPWRGAEIVPPEEPEVIDIPAPPELKDSEDEDEEPRPSTRGRGRGTATGRGRGRGRGRGGATPTTNASAGPSGTASAANTPTSRGSGRGRGRGRGGRGRGRGRGRGPASGSVSAGSNVATPASELHEPEAEAAETGEVYDGDVPMEE